MDGKCVGMPYIKKTCKSGRTKHVECYYSVKWHSKKEGRTQKNQKPTTEAQKKVNLRRAEDILTKKMDANFCGNDYYITLDYRPDERPEGKEELLEQMKKFLRDMRKLYKQEETTLKYIWVAEIGSKGATHIHMVVNEIDIKKLKKMWKYGGMTIKPMWDDGNYRKLAAYFIKYSEKTLNTTGELHGKRWNQSKNLITPPEKIQVIKSRDHYSQNIKVPKGYYLDKDSVRTGVHEITGYSFLRYTLVKME